MGKCYKVEELEEIIELMRAAEKLSLPYTIRKVITVYEPQKGFRMKGSEFTMTLDPEED